MTQAKTTCGKTVTNVQIFESGIAGILEGMTSLGVWNSEGIGSGLTERTRIVMDSFITDEKPVEDVVNHPAHYTTGPWKCGCGETIQPLWIARHMSFARGNCVKYFLRAGLKDPAKEIEDLKKARFYLDDEIKRLENKVC